MKVVRSRIFLRHDLHAQFPAREILIFDTLKQIALRAFAITAHQFGGFSITEVLDALHTLEMKFHPMALVGCIDEAEGMAAETVHVAIRGRNAAIAHDDCDLVQRFRQQGPEIPVVVRAAQIRFRIALDGVVQVWKFQRVAHEKHRCVVTHHIPVAFFGIELDGETADVAFRIGGAPFAGDG